MIGLVSPSNKSLEQAVPLPTGMVFVSAAVVASRNAHHGRQERAVTRQAEVAYAMLNADARPCAHASCAHA